MGGCNGGFPLAKRFEMPGRRKRSAGLRGITRHGLSSCPQTLYVVLSRQKTRSLRERGFNALVPGLAMTSDAKATIQKRSRPQRKRATQKKQLVRTFRLSPEEDAELQANAEKAGLTVGSFVRARILTVPRTGQRRRPSIELETIARLHAEMNRVGSNIHQILKRVNFGETPVAFEFHEALAGYREVIDAIMGALGKKQAA